MTYTVEIPMRFEIRPVDPEGYSRAHQIFLEEMRAAVGDCALHVQERVKLIIEEDDLIDTGQLIGSIATAMGLEDSVVWGAVGTNVKHGIYKEFGTVAHFVPFNLAPGLYLEMQRKFGWVKPDMRRKENRALKVGNPAARRGPHGTSTIKGKHATYLTTHPERLYLQRDRNSRPVWGVWVSGRKRPFMFPGWEGSLAFIENRLRDGAGRAAARINEGEG